MLNAEKKLFQDEKFGLSSLLARIKTLNPYYSIYLSLVVTLLGVIAFHGF